MKTNDFCTDRVWYHDLDDNDSDNESEDDSIDDFQDSLSVQPITQFYSEDLEDEDCYYDLDQTYEPSDNEYFTEDEDTEDFVELSTGTHQEILKKRILTTFQMTS